MKNQFISVVAMILAIAALAVAVSSRQPASAAAAPAAPRLPATDQVRVPAADATTGPDAKIAALTLRIDALEKEVRSDAQFKLLSDVSASLQSMAKRTDKNQEDAQMAVRNAAALARSTQEAMNQVGGEIGRINGELAKIAESVKRESTK